MKHLRAAWRLLAFLATLFWYAFPLWIRAAMAPIDWDHHQAVRQQFCRKAMQIIGIELLVEGQPYTERSCVYASNHRSLLDPFAQMAVVWAFPVAKAEVAKLPIVAGGARATGILFVDRSSKDSRRAVVTAMVAALNSGHSILIYPEGTTSTAEGTIAYRRGGFAVAEEAGCPVVPLAVVYPSTAYHWGDGESLWSNFVQVAGRRRTQLQLIIGEPIAAAAGQNSAAMATAQAWTNAQIKQRMPATPLPVA